MTETAMLDDDELNAATANRVMRWSVVTEGGGAVFGYPFGYARQYPSGKVFVYDDNEFSGRWNPAVDFGHAMTIKDRLVSRFDYTLTLTLRCDGSGAAVFAKNGNEYVATNSPVARAICEAALKVAEAEGWG